MFYGLNKVELSLIGVASNGALGHLSPVLLELAHVHQSNNFYLHLQ